MDVDILFRNGIISILICLVLYALTSYAAQNPALAFLGPVKWFVLALAVAILVIIVIARMSQK